MPQSTLAVTRIALGTMLGVLIGLGGFVLVPVLVEQPDPLLRWGILLWYPTLGAVIGALVGHVVARFPGWVAGALIAAWMTMVLTFFAHRQLKRLMEAVFAGDGAFTSPFWFVLEGAVVGAIIGLAIDRLGAEGEPIGSD